MKLSEIKGDRAIEVIADVMEQISIIAKDEEAMKFFTEKPKDGEKPEQFLAKRLGEKLPYLLKAHKEELYKMFASIEGVSLKEYKETVTISKIIQSILDIFNDEALQLFTSAQPKETNK